MKSKVLLLLGPGFVYRVINSFYTNTDSSFSYFSVELPMKELGVKIGALSEFML